MLYPFRFKPLFRRYLWGGRRLQSVLGKSIGAGEDYAESWETVDHGEYQSVVAHGPFKGVTLHELVTRFAEPLLGCHSPQSQFPLLFKFLDARQNLSVQVHPNDQQAANLDPPSLGKTEAWVVLDARPGSKVYAGLARGVDRDKVEHRIRQGDVESCLHYFEPKVGDCVFLPAGTVHAIGAGLMVAEIQQTSDTTYRLFDWERLGADGKPRQVHVEQALEVICYDAGPVNPQPPMKSDRPHISRLVACDKFIIDRWEFDQIQRLKNDSRCHLLAVLSGSVRVENDPVQSPLSKGGTMLVPAELGAVSIQPLEQSVLLDVYLP